MRGGASVTCRRHSRSNGELTVRQNLVLHARLFTLPEAGIAARVDDSSNALA
jgi:ABC-type Na+ transport system ATPase subunit NatA